jgi:Xaa-Pro aminopeptidase
MLASGSIEGDGGARYLLHGIAPPNGPTFRPLQKGDVVLSEFHCSVAGYLSATEFSFSVGRAPEPLRRIHEVQVACLEHVLPYFKSGVALKEVWEAIRQPCLEAGLDYLELGFHGHGLASPEFPTVVYKPGEGTLDGKGLGEFQLSENMVFGTNIDIYDPSWKPNVGLMFGDTVVVTPEGGRRLCDVPLDFPEVN